MNDGKKGKQIDKEEKISCTRIFNTHGIELEILAYLSWMKKFMFYL
ncbi:MAG: hypothetical protein ACTSVI_16095 [Promethearchaeota archaeon]